MTPILKAEAEQFAVRIYRQPKKRKCRTCKGTGRVQLPPAYPRFHPADGDCPDCKK